MNPQQLLSGFSSFVENFKRQNPGVNPQAMVQNLLNQGKMTQEQFNKCRDMANQMMGTSF